MRNDKENIIVELTFKFSLHIIQYCEQLERERKYVISQTTLKILYVQLEQMLERPKC